MATKRVPGSGVRRKKGGGKGGRGVYFLSLTLENVRCFGPAQTLDLSDGQGRPRQWTVILGNNGVGKTTLLLALAGSTPVPFKSEAPKPFIQDGAVASFGKHTYTQAQLTPPGSAT